jgi:hypothetical protein
MAMRRDLESLARHLPALAIERQEIEALVDLESDSEVDRVATARDQPQRAGSRLHGAVAATRILYCLRFTTTKRRCSTVTSDASSVTSPISSRGLASRARALVVREPVMLLAGRQPQLWRWPVARLGSRLSRRLGAGRVRADVPLDDSPKTL